MSMTGKTTNELFPVGQNTDTVSIFDLNVITEKADALIHELQGKDSLTASELEEVKTKLTQLTQGLTTVTQTAGTNATNIASLQNSIDSLSKNLKRKYYNLTSTSSSWEVNSAFCQKNNTIIDFDANMTAQVASNTIQLNGFPFTGTVVQKHCFVWNETDSQMLIGLISKVSDGVIKVEIPVNLSKGTTVVILSQLYCDN